MRLGFHATGGALALLFLFPLLWSGYSSFKGQPGTSQEAGFGFGNYVAMAQYGEGVGTYLVNTAAVSLMTVAGTLFVSALGGYGFARFSFPGKNLLFLATLAILMVPYATILIPLYVVLGHLGLQNSLVGLSLVLIMFQLPFSVFMMRNSFEAIPRELEESAQVDGCGSLRALTLVMLPAVRPGLVTVGLFAFLISWSEFFAPLILLNSTDKFTTILAVVNMRTASHGSIDYAALEAGVVFMAVPCLLLFAFMQRSYIRGFTSGALKG